MKQLPFFRCLCFFCLLLTSFEKTLASELTELDLHVIPYPQEVKISGEGFRVPQRIFIVVDKNASVEDAFAAQQLIRGLKDEYAIEASITTAAPKGAIALTRKGSDRRIGAESYRLSVSSNGVILRAADGAGLFYATQTLLQLFKDTGNGYVIPGVEISDWPDIKVRAVHYDTKHHQDKEEYVRRFIRDLARYKINMLVWEWEDKLAYTSHPEIGAPGAFTIEEMAELTKYARQYHVELVPLVQGLGHVSFILKWPQHAHLREIGASNWEFCPLKDDSYQLLFDLWDEAIKATPGSRYVHIGSDETYELGMCDACKQKANEIGKSGLYTLFVNRAARHLKALGREAMAWERPMGWVKSSDPAVGITPDKNVILTESYDYEDGNFTFAKEAKKLGYKIFAYDPNPGIEHIFLPYFFRERQGRKVEGSLQESYEFLTSNTRSGVFDGLISTSWDDSGLHNQVWMLRFATAAAFSWNGNEPGLDEFRKSFFKNYYGQDAKDLDELFQLFNEGALYYMRTFERRVWHHGVIGKTHLPDLPRGDALEYDPYWNEEYSDIIELSEAIAPKMERALAIIEANTSRQIRNRDDLEIFLSMAKLVWHTTQTYKDLSTLENLITLAHRKHFESYELAYQHLNEAATVVAATLKRRSDIFHSLVVTWEKTRLPKGLSTDQKTFFFQQDRARHFANRTPDMTYLITDEIKLDMEGYLEKLLNYMDYYREAYLR